MFSTTRTSVRTKTFGALATGLLAAASVVGIQAGPAAAQVPAAAQAAAGPAAAAGAEGAARTAPSGPSTAERKLLRHVTSKPRPVSPEVAKKIKEGARPKNPAGLIAGADEWTTPWTSWNPDGTTSYARMHVYLDYGSDGKLHDWAWGEAYLYHGADEVYVDVSNTSGNGHWPWQAYRGQQWITGVTFHTASSHYDGPGYWVRVCGASFGYGDPFGNPQWGWNINCTAWN